MKKLLFICICLCVFVSTAFSFGLRDTGWMKTQKAGQYTCPYTMVIKYTQKTSTTCTVGIDGDGGYFLSNCPDNDEELKNLVNSGKCTYQPLKETKYSCHYAQGSCEVSISSVFGTSISCSGNVTTEQAKSDYKAGKCYKE